MATNLENFARELATKQRALTEDRSRYLRIADNETYIRVGQQYVPLLPDAGHLSPEEFQRAVASAPYWHENAPICKDRPQSHVIDLGSKPGEQGDRNTCVSFACMAGIQYVLKRDHAAAIDLSEEYANWLFMAMEGEDSVCNEFVETKRAIEHLEKYGVCLEEELPYLTADELQFDHDCNLRPPEPARDNAIYGIDKSSLIAGPGMEGPCIGNPDYLECLLLNNEAIVVAVDLAIGREDKTPGDGIYDVLLDEYGQPEIRSGSHAMLLIGYHRDGVQKPYFIFRNSWGEDADHGGNIYLSYEYVEWYARYGALIRSVSQTMQAPDYYDLGNYWAVGKILSRTRRRYQVRAGEWFEVELPRIPRALGGDVLGLRCEVLGESIEDFEKKKLDDDLLLPVKIGRRAVRRGLSHLIIRGYNRRSGIDIKKMRPLVISVEVSD